MYLMYRNHFIPRQPFWGALSDKFGGGLRPNIKESIQYRKGRNKNCRGAGLSVILRYKILKHDLYVFHRKDAIFMHIAKRAFCTVVTVGFAPAQQFKYPHRTFCFGKILRAQSKILLQTHKPANKFYKSYVLFGKRFCR